jgi:hypothetical protein
MVRSLSTGVAALVSLLSTLAAAYTAIKNPEWPAIATVRAEPWHFFLLAYSALVVTAITAYHRLVRRTDELTTQVDQQWREERKALEREYKGYRNELSQFLMTLKNLFIQQNWRQVTTTWHDYLPVPPVVEPDIYSFAFDLWESGWVILGDEGKLEALKQRFRKIHGFFDRLYDLMQDFPEQAPQYVDERIKPSQFDPLHIVWYFGHALADVTYGEEKRSQYTPPPPWHRLWVAWNPGTTIPIGPGEYINYHDLPIWKPISGQQPDPTMP